MKIEISKKIPKQYKAPYEIQMIKALTAIHKAWHIMEEFDTESKEMVWCAAGLVVMIEKEKDDE